MCILNSNAKTSCKNKHAFHFPLCIKLVISYNYLAISVQASILSNCPIEFNRIEKSIRQSATLIEQNRNIFPWIDSKYCTAQAYISTVCINTVTSTCEMDSINSGGGGGVNMTCCQLSTRCRQASRGTLKWTSIRPTPTHATYITDPARH